MLYLPCTTPRDPHAPFAPRPKGRGGCRVGIAPVIALCVLGAGCAGGASDSTDSTDSDPVEVDAGACVSFPQTTFGAQIFRHDRPSIEGTLRIDNVCDVAVDFERVVVDAEGLILPESLSVPAGGVELPVTFTDTGLRGSDWVTVEVALYVGEADAVPAVVQEVTWMEVEQRLTPFGAWELVAPVGCPQLLRRGMGANEHTDAIIQSARLGSAASEDFDLSFENLPLRVRLPNHPNELIARLSTHTTFELTSTLILDGQVYEPLRAQVTIVGIPSRGQFDQSVENTGEEPVEYAIEARAPIDPEAVTVTVDGAASAGWTVDDRTITVSVPAGVHRVVAEWGYRCEA